MQHGADLVPLLGEVAAAVRRSLSSLDDWGPSGRKPGQYRSDLVADEVAVGLLLDAGLGVLSEESGLHESGRALLAVLDPLDGSTNAARGVPWFATSVCVLDDGGPLAACVVNQASGVTYDAWRDGGARRDGVELHVGAERRLGESFVALSGYPPRHLGWRQYRSLGAAALDLCAVAAGVFDAFLDCGVDAHGAWDYLGGLLVCSEAGASAADARGRDLVVRTEDERRTPVAATGPALLAEVLDALGSSPTPRDR